MKSVENRKETHKEIVISSITLSDYGFKETPLVETEARKENKRKEKADPERNSSGTAIIFITKI